jgi:hypothetical protein
MPLVLSAPCPGAMGSPHGPRRWRRPPCPSRSTSRARPGTRPRAALFVVTSYTVLRHFTILLNASRRRDARYGLGSARHSEVAGAPLAHTNDNHNIKLLLDERDRASRPRHEVCNGQRKDVRRRRGPRANDVTKVESKESRRTAHKTMNRTNIAISRGSSPTPDPWNDATMLRRLHP